MSFCGKCGVETNPSNNFCTACGVRTEGSVKPTEEIIKDFSPDYPNLHGIIRKNPPEKFSPREFSVLMRTEEGREKLRSMGYQVD